MARLSLLLLLLLCSFRGLSQKTAMVIAAGQFIKKSGARSAQMKKITDM